jgi:hypothetical protein
MIKILVKDLEAILCGSVTIKQWQDETESYKVLYSNTHFLVMNLSEELKNMEITSIYADQEDINQHFIIVEVE